MAFSLLPMLLTGPSLSASAREALRENRIEESAAILMKEYGLTCHEVDDLLNQRVCETTRPKDRR